MEATNTLSSVRPAKSKFIFRTVVLSLVVLLLAFLGFDFWFYRAVQASLPQRDGTIHLSGLAAPVIVTYDSLGVPNISASNLGDLFFAQGYITAQDRLWQMDMTRRFASGDLAVILGPKYLKYDREQRILGLQQVAEQVAAAMDAASAATSKPMPPGSTPISSSTGKRLPLEFRFLTYFPHVWTVEDSLLVGLVDDRVSQPRSLQGQAGEGKDSGQAWSGADGRSVRQHVVARSSAGRRQQLHRKRDSRRNDAG